MAAANKTSARSERTSGVGPLTIEGDWAPLIYLRAKGARRAGDDVVVIFRSHRIH